MSVHKQNERVLALAKTTAFTSSDFIGSNQITETKLKLKQKRVENCKNKMHYCERYSYIILTSQMMHESIEGGHDVRVPLSLFNTPLIVLPKCSQCSVRRGNCNK